MKTKNTSVLKFKKSKISSFKNLSHIIGGTNDKTKTLETPTLVLGCNGLQTGEEC